ncbi:MAG: hypothetical protein LH702_30605 [Phormidesmis sp. CAN_BIN44]|nr:hypothetical protein [Phormidesmis sp. CAN_BIN44]
MKAPLTFNGTTRRTLTFVETASIASVNPEITTCPGLQAQHLAFAQFAL